jgi:hypothetical protein
MTRTLILAAAVLVLAGAAPATPTEHQAFRILPAPGKVVVDGRFGDWDLTGGIFICDDPETQREKFAVWYHAMYDADNLYVLARWVDPTPLNNPGVTIADHGFQADCLQFRTVAAPGTPNESGNHFTCWRGKDGKDVIKIERGLKFDGGVVDDAKKEGARQAFQVDADGKGYVQEIAVPWKMLTRDGRPLGAGAVMTMTVEPNFTIGASGRLTIKDLFRPGMTPDRVFTFMASQCWGPAALEPKGNVAPQPCRLADAREFPVRMQKGVPEIDWTGLARSKELPGFKDIAFTMPEDGYISLNIKNADGQVVRQLLTCTFMTKGRHTVKWDGLTTWSWTRPGQPVPPGEYAWSALWHKGIGLRLVGWAHNAGRAPWDDGSGTSNWGGDHGVPVACAAEGDMVYLGWNGAEAGQAVVGADIAGNVRWRNTRFSMTGVTHVAADGGIFYGAARGDTIYRLEGKTGAYSMWEGAQSCDLVIKNLMAAAPGKPEKCDGLDARAGKLYVAFAKDNCVAVVDGRNGKLLKILAVPSPGSLKAAGDSLLYVVCGAKAVLAVNPQSGEARTFADGLSAASAVTVDSGGRVYVAVGPPDNQVKVYDPSGRETLAIGRRGGRATLGPWTPDGMAFASGLTVDAEGKLWVAEADQYPKRISTWDAGSGRFIREYFGPTAYGALGGAINPLDPTIMVGHGCEWKLDPGTGRAACTYVITRDGMSNSRFGTGPNGRLYLAVAGGWAFETPAVSIYERTAAGEYKLRSAFTYEVNPADKKIARTVFWADENGDGARQESEIASVPGQLRISGWYMYVTPDLTFYAGDLRLKVAGFTACGAPRYDLAGAVKMPARGLGSADGRLLLQWGDYGIDHGLYRCFDAASGKVLWTYPDNFVGVHGSHNACPPQGGMIRGSFDPCGAARLPEPVGDVWVIATNVGEWHILTGEGFYLTRLFQPDPLKVEWPAQAAPGAVLDNCPCGSGGEDFGGSICLANNGRLYVQAGKTAFWNVEVVGLDTVKAVKGDKVKITDADARKAEAVRVGQLQAAVGTRRATVRRMTPPMTGDFDNDFKGAEVIQYKKQDEAAVRSAAAWDDRNLYLAWDVRDKTPWQNAAGLPEFLYCKGDSVDFQLGTDPKADKNRGEAAAGDLRLSIGNFKGTPTAVLFRKVAKDRKNRKVFSSGVVREYPMDSVAVVDGARIEVRKRGDGYVVEAAVPLEALDLRPADGLVLRGDLGALHGDPGGQDTVLRTYWNNQHSGIVNDEVFELQMEPRNWGELIFKP